MSKESLNVVFYQTTHKAFFFLSKQPLIDFSAQTHPNLCSIKTLADYPTFVDENIDLENESTNVTLELS